MSKIAELSMEIDDLVEQGMTAKFISVTLNIPIEFVYAAIDARYELENQTHNQYYEEE